MLVKTETEKNARYEGNKFAHCFIDGPMFSNDPKFDLVVFEQKYNQGQTRENLIFGYHFASTCADLMVKKSEDEIRQRTPDLLNVLSTLNDDQFQFGLNCFKNRMDMWHPYFSKVVPSVVIDLIKESVANTALETHPVIENITNSNKEKVINNISTLRESVIGSIENKLKNT